MDRDKNWTRWVLQTANNWKDMKFIIQETGIAHIDHEHKRMTDYMIELNKLLFELEKSFTPELYDSQKKMMKSFYEYTAKHCANEEKFIQTYNIPGIENQQKEHRKLLTLMKEIIFQFDTGRVTSAFRLRIKLLILVVDHINNVDNKVFGFKNISNNILEVVTWDEINTFIRLIHVPIIDYQHKILTEMIINLLQTLSIDSDSELIQTSKEEELKGVINFSIEHFETETSIIEKYNIESISVQNKQHHLFVEFLNKTLESFKAGKDFDLQDLKERLLLWWIKHINIFDYRTFRRNDWIKPILINSTKPDDVTWLIAKMGIEQVDTDHLKFIDILFDNVEIFEHSSEVSVSAREEGLNKLYVYAKNHFEREEIIMEQKDVLDREQHMMEHRSILKTLERFAELNLTGKVDLSKAFKRKILNLWINHINDTDTATFGVSYD